jgi:hypothetical protein
MSAYNARVDLAAVPMARADPDEDEVIRCVVRRYYDVTRHERRHLVGCFGSAGEFDVFVDTLIRELANLEPPCWASIPNNTSRSADSGRIG